MWSSWSTCSEPTYCLQGVSKRTRTCTNPPPANGGDDCVGLSAESKDCPTQADGCTSKTLMVNIPGEKGARACALTYSPHRFSHVLTK